MCLFVCVYVCVCLSIRVSMCLRVRLSVQLCVCAVRSLSAQAFGSRPFGLNPVSTDLCSCRELKLVSVSGTTAEFERILLLPQAPFLLLPLVMLV